MLMKERGEMRVKINEVEAKAGITKKNIRFYEEAGLLSPRRNAENGYREYGEEDVQQLLKIKLLRKLGVPLEEIRQMLSGVHTVGDGMRRHLITLERDMRNLETAAQMCRDMQNEDVPLQQLDGEMYLNRMAQMEQMGAVFVNGQKKDEKNPIVAPVVITVFMVAFMLAMCLLLLWACKVSPGDAPPLWFIGLFILGFLGVAVGAVLALVQRIKEIGKGEMDDAKRY